MKKTILYDTHVSLGAKMAPFGGYEMPIQYEGIFAEHFATRKNATIFDTCHMGEFIIRGALSTQNLDAVLSCDVASLKIGDCKYGFICNKTGGIIDDQIIYKLDNHEYFMVVNASTQDNDFEWVKSYMSPSTSITNISKETGKVDVQGPESAKIMNKLLKDSIDDLKYYHWMYNSYKDEKVIVSRTGYTGEIGFEIYLNENLTSPFWNDCLQLGVKPAGLGARDTLRLEMGYPLYGHELDENRNAAESGLTRAIAPSKEFVGSQIVLDSNKAQQMLCGIKLDGRRAARNGDAICDNLGTVIGTITSGSFSPTLQYAIAFGYVNKQSSALGTSLVIRAGKNELKGIIVDMPFFKDATARKKLTDFL